MQVGLINNNRFNSYNAFPQEVNFGAAKDLNLRYILRNRAHLLPERMNERVAEVVHKSEGFSVEQLPTLKELHEEVYAPIMKAESLDAVRKFSEFEDVVDFATVHDKFPRIAPQIAANMTYDRFSLDLLKKVWSGMTMEEIAETYGFSGRAVVAKLCQGLNIPKPLNNYLVLLKMSTEAGNERAAEISRRYVDISMRNLALANIANKTPEARARHAAAVSRNYQEHPEKRRAVSVISRETWARCPEIRQAKSAYCESLTPYQKMVFQKHSAKQPLTAQEKRVLAAIHKGFWDKYPHFKILYSQVRREVAREFREGTLSELT